MTAQISKPTQKRLYSCVLSPPKWVKTHKKLENRACRTVNIDDLTANAAARVENAHKNAYSRVRYHCLGNISSS